MRSDQIPSFRSFDGPYTFRGANGVEGRCYLSVYEHRGALPVVLVYELASNEGPSVTWNSFVKHFAIFLSTSLVPLPSTNKEDGSSFA